MNQDIKVLILGQSFDNFSGGGITLSNLFRGWPRENIAVICTPFYLQDISIDICNTYYQIGLEEYHWKFPFNLYKKSYPSGLLEISGNEFSPVSQKKRDLKQFFSNRMVYPLIKWIGLSHAMARIDISVRLKKWLEVFNPDILYIQITGEERENILFALRLIDYLRVPSAIHMMDDWPSTICSKGLYKSCWKKRIISEFKNLLDRVNLHLSISNAMSEEYQKRYQKNFTSFHNPVDILNYNIINKEKLKEEDCYRILYVGRIGIANKKSIYLFSKTISQIKVQNVEIKMDIFSVDANTHGLNILKKLRNVKISSSVPHDIIPSLLKEYDLLLLPLDFTKNGLKYAALSIPTKASEYMFSGTPILVLAPETTAVSKFFSAHECGYCVNEPNKIKIEQAISFLIKNKEYTTQISRNAVLVATGKFDAIKIRKEFQKKLMETSKRFSDR